MKAMGAPILNGSASEWALGGERRGRGDRRVEERVHCAGRGCRETGGLKPGVEHVLIERNFVGSRIGKNFADDVCRQKGERYFVSRGKHDDVGAGGAAVAELDCAGVDAFDVRTRDNAAAGDVVDEGGRHSGLALGDAHAVRRWKRPGAGDCRGRRERSEAELIKNASE